MACILAVLTRAEASEVVLPKGCTIAHDGFICTEIPQNFSFLNQSTENLHLRGPNVALEPGQLSGLNLRSPSTLFGHM